MFEMVYRCFCEIPDTEEWLFAIRDDEQWETTTLWAPWEACAKIFETQEDAMKYCPDLAVVIKVNAQTMEVIE